MLHEYNNAAGVDDIVATAIVAVNAINQAKNSKRALTKIEREQISLLYQQYQEQKQSLKSTLSQEKRELVEMVVQKAAEIQKLNQEAAKDRMYAEIALTIAAVSVGLFAVIYLVKK